MLTAKDIMTKKVVTVKPDTSIKELSALFVKHGLSGAPVIDEGGGLYGVVTENDLISQNKRLHIPTVINFLDAAIYLESSKKFEQELKRMAATKVADICAKKVITITEDTSVTDIATIMSEKQVHLLPVVKDGKVIGVIGKRDVVKAMARQAE
jgi:CBS domain-containing protein